MKKVLIKKFEALFEKMQDKGHETMTMMIIPHGESNILSLQMSKFTIVFLIIFIAVVILASALSAYLQEGIRGDLNKFYDAKETLYHESELYTSRYQDLTIVKEKVNGFVEELFQNSDLEQNFEIHFQSKSEIKATAQSEMEHEGKLFTQEMARLAQKQDVGFSLDSIQKKLLAEFTQLRLKAKFSFHKQVVEYRRIHLELTQAIKALRVFQNLVVERIKVQNGLPFYLPIVGGHFTSMFGYRQAPDQLFKTEFHTGIDIASKVGTAIFATANGKVISSGLAGGYGLRVVLEHRFGFQTVYAHMNRLGVSLGANVVKGQVIGEVGKTGRTTGPHLHYELKVDSKFIDPKPYMFGY